MSDVKTAAPIIPVPDLDGPSVVFGDISFLPKRNDLPEEFQRDWHRNSHPWCGLVSHWFYNGADAASKDSLTIKGVTLRAKDGVDFGKACRAIKAALGSWEPQHEHKIGGVGYLMSIWFDRDAKAAK